MIDPFPEHANVRWQLILDLFGFGVGGFQQVAHKRSVDGIELRLIDGAWGLLVFYFFEHDEKVNQFEDGLDRLLSFRFP